MTDKTHGGQFYLEESDKLIHFDDIQSAEVVAKLHKLHRQGKEVS